MSKKSKGKNNHPAPQPKQNRSDNESTNRHVYIEPGARIDFVQDIKDKYDSAKRDETAQNKKQLFWTKIATVLLLLTAGFAGLQGYLTRDSIRNNTKQFQIDQRPYIWDSNVTSAPSGWAASSGSCTCQ
jgi:hypothetical protein